MKDEDGWNSSRLAEKKAGETGFSIGRYVSVSTDWKNKPAYNSLHNFVLTSPVIFHLKIHSKIKINTMLNYIHFIT